MVSENWAVLRLLDLVQVNFKIGMFLQKQKKQNTFSPNIIKIKSHPTKTSERHFFHTPYQH